MLIRKLLTAGACLLLNGCTLYDYPRMRKDYPPGDDIGLGALALPVQKIEDRFAQLKVFLDKYPGGYEFYFSDKGGPSPAEGYQSTGLVWEGFHIWTRKIRRYS